MVRQNRRGDGVDSLIASHIAEKVKGECDMYNRNAGIQDHRPKVSVIIPVYNVSRYLRPCLESVTNQSLRDMEIICINDGSTDDSLLVLREYASKDDRIVIIDKENAGYGAAMNDGLDAATGRYVAFLESDDQIETTAYEQLYAVAEEHELEIIKGNYYNIYGEEGCVKRQLVRLFDNEDLYGKVIRPLDDSYAFYAPMMNWLGIFNREFLAKNAIKHQETPGASQQDLGFWFQTFCCANRLMFIDEAFYMYRQDNENSSMKDGLSAHRVLREYQFMMNFLDKRPELKSDALPVYYHRKYRSCTYACAHSFERIKLGFLETLGEEFKRDYEAGKWNSDIFPCMLKNLA